MSQHNHTYSGCDHNLKFCSHCDTVYCTKCSREWDNGKNHICGGYKSLDWTYVPWNGTSRTVGIEGRPIVTSASTQEHKHE